MNNENSNKKTTTELEIEEKEMIRELAEDVHSQTQATSQELSKKIPEDGNLTLRITDLDDAITSDKPKLAENHTDQINNEDKKTLSVPSKPFPRKEGQLYIFESSLRKGRKQKIKRLAKSLGVPIEQIYLKRKKKKKSQETINVPATATSTGNQSGTAPLPAPRQEQKVQDKMVRRQRPSTTEGPLIFIKSSQRKGRRKTAKRIAKRMGVPVENVVIKRPKAADAALARGQIVLTRREAAEARRLGLYPNVSRGFTPATTFDEKLGIFRNISRRFNTASNGSDSATLATSTGYQRESYNNSDKGSFSHSDRDSRLHGRSYDPHDQNTYRDRSPSRDTGRNSQGDLGSLQYEPPRGTNRYGQSPDYRRDNDRSSYVDSNRDSHPYDASVDPVASPGRKLFRESSRPNYRHNTDTSSYSHSDRESRKYDARVDPAASSDRNLFTERSRSPNYRHNTDRSSYSHTDRESRKYDESVEAAASSDRNLFRGRSRSPNYRRNSDRRSYSHTDRGACLYGESSNSIFLSDGRSPGSRRDTIEPPGSSTIGRNSLDYHVHPDRGFIPPYSFERTGEPDEGVKTSLLSRTRGEESNSHVYGVSFENRTKSSYFSNQTDPPGYSNTGKNTSDHLGNRDRLRTKTNVNFSTTEVTIVPDNFPQTVFTTTQAEVVKILLVSQIRPGNEGSGPQFIGINFQQGKLIVTCRNMETKAWLENLVPRLPRLQGWGLGYLKTIMSEDLPSTVIKVVMMVPYPMAGNSPKTLLNILKTQNIGLQTEHWRIVDANKTDTGLTVFLYMDAASVDALQRFDMKPCLGPSKATFKLLMDRKKAMNAGNRQRSE